MVAPPIGTPPLYHWLPVGEDEVRVTLPPAQKVVVPPADIVGVAGSGVTVKSEPLWIVPPGVVTLILPVLTDVGEIAVICVGLFTVKDAAGVPLKLTTLAPLKLVPVITTDDVPEPKQPLVGVKLVMVGAPIVY